MSQPDRTEPTTATGRHTAPAAARQPRHRAPHQPVPAPGIPRWLPRAALAAGAAVALGVGVMAATGAAGTPNRHSAPGATPAGSAASGAPAAAAGIARLSLGAPKGAKLLQAQPVHVARPAAATPAAVTGLAANGIPAVALNAYRLAAARLASAQPGCGIQWWLLAGIGRVESNHGRYGGATLNASGESTPHIVGDALDGTVYDYIADTDGGRLDGDARYDHAVGPMQFIPSTWAAYGLDGNGDGVASPFNINDAALAAARYLCAAGGDLRTADGQRRAVLAYNHSDEYLSLVLGTASAYATGTPVGAPVTGITTGSLPPVNTSWLPPVNPGRPVGLPTSHGRSAGSSHAGSSGSGTGTSHSGTGSSGSGAGSSGTGSSHSGAGSSGTGSSGTGSSGTGSTAGNGKPAPSAAPSLPVTPKPTSAPTSSSPALPGLPLPTGSIPVPVPSPTNIKVCTTSVAGVVLPVPCTTH
jgi:membrane-bound lytic murein transglycosylase B